VLANHIPYFTTIAAARATAMAIRELKESNTAMEPKALQDYLT
jgi:carbamoyl-phosphate synthase large subunit